MNPYNHNPFESDAHEIINEFDANRELAHNAHVLSVNEVAELIRIQLKLTHYGEEK